VQLEAESKRAASKGPQQFLNCKIHYLFVAPFTAFAFYIEKELSTYFRNNFNDDADLNDFDRNQVIGDHKGMRVGFFEQGGVYVRGPATDVKV